MSTAVWPSVSSEERIKAEEDTRVSSSEHLYQSRAAIRVVIDSIQAKELAWLLEYLQETLESFKEGLEECRRLLAPTEPGSTLAMSSLRSEQVKGYISRVGTEVVKGVCVDLDFINFMKSPNAEKLANNAFSPSSSNSDTHHPSTSPSIVLIPSSSRLSLPSATSSTNP